MTRVKAPQATIPGVVVAVRLPGGGYARAVFSHCGSTIRGDTPAFAYGFGPKYDKVPSTRVFARLKPENARLIHATSDAGLRAGGWKILGVLPNFDSKDWPLPFVAQDYGLGAEDMGGPPEGWRVMHPNTSLFLEDLSEWEWVAPNVANQYPESGSATASLFARLLRDAIKYNWKGRQPVEGLKPKPMRLWDKGIRDVQRWEPDKPATKTKRRSKR